MRIFFAMAYSTLQIKADRRIWGNHFFSFIRCCASAIAPKRLKGARVPILDLD